MGNEEDIGKIIDYSGREFQYIGTRTIRPDGVDKVTGRANFGADFTVNGMIHGRVVRSPHAHAKIKKINIDKALKLDGVKAVVTGKDFPEIDINDKAVGEVVVSYYDMAHNIIARDKVYYDGHAVAAVAATTPDIAEKAAKLIEVEYDVLKPVMTAAQAMKKNAPVLHKHIVTSGVEPKPEKPSNVASRTEFKLGDPDAGFSDADVIVEREFSTQTVHQGYIEPHACCASISADGNANVWCSSQGQFMVRAYTAKICGMETSRVKVIPAEIGGGFGGKTVVYL